MRNLIDPRLLLALLPACALGEIHAFHDELDATATESGGASGDTTGDADSSGTWPGSMSTVTSATSSSGEPTSGDSSGATSGIDSTSGDPEGPPSISGYNFTPQPITAAGPIAVKIWADADGVRMDLAGAVTELTPTEPGLFEGEILAVTGFDHGGVAVFTPWREDALGAALEVPYSVQLPEPGGEALFDVDYESKGQVSAIGALDEGGVVELVTLVGENNVSGCYLRRRDEMGISGPDDLYALLPDHCKGIDLEVGPDGMYVLIDGETLNGHIWWAAKIQYFGAWPKTIGYGGDEEVAHDLAVSPSGTVAVCGSAPTTQPGDLTDAMVRVYRPSGFEHTKTFDLVKDDTYHTLDERSRGCDFVDDDRLIIVGDVFGRQDWDMVKRKRRFDVLYHVDTDLGELRVATPGLATQSVASDVAVDRDQGRAFVVGYIADDDLSVIESQLWMLDVEGDLASTTALGLHSIEALAANTVRWNAPAKYVVVASGGLIGSEPAFTVRAYAPFKSEPLWIFSREDQGLVHLAHALAIGRYGQVYAGGFGANGYPLFAVIHG